MSALPLLDEPVDTTLGTAIDTTIGATPAGATTTVSNAVAAVTPLRPRRPVAAVPGPAVRLHEDDLPPAEIRRRHVERLTGGRSELDQRFDRIASLACTLFAVPMASVTLVDGDTALFTGRTGFEMRSVDARDSFCDHTVRGAVPLVVEDATGDPRFAALPTVTGYPYLRFYAGVPLADDDGVVVGSFCVYDTVPRRLDATQLSTLVELATWARRELLDSAEMSHARAVQSALLPRRSIAPPGYELATVCRPTKSVGGDFFDHAVLDGRLFLTLVDVMGKGVGAGLVAASVRAMARASLVHQRELDRLGGRSARPRLDAVVATTDRLLADDLGQTGTLLTGFAAAVEPHSGELDWVDAGHGLALISRADGSVERLTGDDLPLGLGIGASWTQRRTVLHPGETLLVVSDGLFDLLGSSADVFDKLAYLVRTDPRPADLITRISELTVLGTALDDVTAVALRREETS